MGNIFLSGKCSLSNSYNVEHWRGLGICCYVRPADAHIKERKFPCNHQTSQQTKSVAKSAGG